VQPDHHDDEAEDQAWRAIVENYGDRADIDGPPPVAPAPDDASDASDAVGDVAGPPDPAPGAPFGGRFGDLRRFATESEDDPFVADEDEGYVPPPPPPLPRVEPDRMLAWIGVFGSPAVLLCALIFSFSLPSWLGYLLVAAFVGGFIYLVVKMPREPREPWDDGAQV